MRKYLRALSPLLIGVLALSVAHGTLVSSLVVTLGYSQVSKQQPSEQATRKKPAGIQLPVWPQFRQNNEGTGVGLGGGSNGQLRWRLPLDEWVQTTPAIGPDGTLYAGAANYYAIDPSGSQKWKLATNGVTETATPAISPSGTIYIASANHNLYAVNPDGSVQWSFKTGNGIGGSPSLDPDGTIYFHSLDHIFYALNPDGTQKWSTRFTCSNATPSIGPDGTIYMSSADLYAHAFNHDGSVKWAAYIGDSSSAPALGTDGTIYLTTWSTGLYALNPDGTTKFVFNPGFGNASSPALASDGTIYVGSSDRHMYALNPDGTVKWSFATGDQIKSSPVLRTDGTIYFASQDKNLYALNPDGTLQWTYSNGCHFISSPSIGLDGTLYIGADDLYLYAIGTQVNTVPVSSAFTSPTTVVGGSRSTGTVILSRAAPKGGDIITLASSSVNVSVPPLVMVKGGATQATFDIKTKAVAATGTVAITATSGGKTATTSVTVQAPNLTGVSIAPTAIVGGNTPTGGTVSLSSIAPAGGMVVHLSSDHSAASLPTSVTVPGGASTVSFPVKTIGVDSKTSVVFTASFGGVSKTCTLLVLPAWINTVTIKPTSVTGGSTTTVTGSAALVGLAGPSGSVVLLSSSNPAAASVPASVTVAGGNRGTTFPVTTKIVTSAQTVTITAKANGYTATTTLTVNPSNLASVSIVPLAIVGGNTPTGGTVTLVNPAPTGGTIVSLSSSSTCLQIPSTVTIPAGSSSAKFGATTTGVNSNTTVTISANLIGISKTAQMLVLPPSLYSIGVTPSTVKGGSTVSVTGTVRLNGRTGSSGLVVNLTSSNSNIASVPASVTALSSGSSVTFSVKTHVVTSNQTITITATLAGKSMTTSLTVTP